MDALRPLPSPLESWWPPLPASTRPRGRQEAEEVARELEAIFLGELLKSLEATLPSGSLLGPGGSQIRAAMVREELARFLARQGGIGLADLIVESLPQAASRPERGEETEARSEND